MSTYKVVKCMNLMITVLSISKFGIVSSYVIKYALLIAGIEPNPGPQLNNKKNIKIIHNNVCSLLPKLDLIEHEFLDYDVICISESHLDKSIDNDKIKLKGFQNLWIKLLNIQPATIPIASVITGGNHVFKNGYVSKNSFICSIIRLQNYDALV